MLLSVKIYLEKGQFEEAIVFMEGIIKRIRRHLDRSGP